MIQINVKIKKDPTCLSQQELSELVKKQIETHPLRIDGSSITVESTPSPNDSQQTVNSNNLVEDNLKHLSPHSCHCYSHTQPLDFSFPTLSSTNSTPYNKEDPNNIGLGEDILSIVFSYADFETLKVIPHVCKLWKSILQKNRLWRDIANHQNLCSGSVCVSEKEKETALLHHCSWHAACLNYQMEKSIEGDEGLQQNLRAGLGMVLKHLRSRLVPAFPHGAFAVVRLSIAFYALGFFDSLPLTTRAQIACNLGALADHVLGAPDTAELLFREGLVLNGRDAVAMCNLGALVQNIHHCPSEAANLYNKAITCDPSYWVGYANLAFLRFRFAHDISGARKLFQKAIEKGAENASQIRIWLQLHPSPCIPANDNSLSDLSLSPSSNIIEAGSVEDIAEGRRISSSSSSSNNNNNNNNSLPTASSPTP